MRTLVSVAWSSLRSRKKTVVLTFLSLLISIIVLLTVEHIRLQAKESFNRTISGVDLIVGAPSGQLNLLLYSVFRMGSPTNNIKYESFQMLNESELVDWAIPISLGDSHKGFRVIGTDSQYFSFYRFGNQQSLSFSEGRAFEGMFETVLGADVAKALGYKLGDKIVIAHGIGSTSFKHHDHAPFVISGILNPTGTPIDKSLHLSLSAIEAIHLSPSELQLVIDNPKKYRPQPDTVTSVMLGLKSKFSIFGLQRNINNYQDDRLMAVLPGVAMAELWTLMSTVENVLRVISVLVLISSLFGLSTMLLASMNERRSEIAVFRVLGAGPTTILVLIVLEALILVALAIVFSFVLLSLGLSFSAAWLASEFGLFLTADVFSAPLFTITGFIFIATLVVSIYPGIEAYRNALHAQLSNK
ncbi:ABC transporter permease [Glaciecola petra]|uniref:FtsX-like permease family protein n=1 Tax=Glaciecola petra TaxID=3075602 RepID=A0ABU2ZRZ2_9ALTE|nr:FtsX-like permease family protein [Aestuariibacter sp. P117]MDT0595190.1 FtsX-like permease family protein [Aestuariibacter sp. P117]